MITLENLYRVRLTDPIAAGDVTPMMCFPIGEWHSAKYPDLPLTEDLANELIANFEAGVLGTEPVVDSSGRHDTSAPAAGWVKRVYLASYEEGDITGLALWADVKWTDLGAELLASEQYKYGSVEIGPVVLNDSGETVENVLRSLTLTNTPVLRIMPDVQNAAEKQRVVATLSEFTLDDGETEPDPVAAILDDMDALAARLDDALKGKRGMPSVRTYLREIRSKVSAHKLADDDSYQQLRDELADAIGGNGWVCDFGDDWVVYEVSAIYEGGREVEPSGLYRAPYVRDESGITLGHPVEVKRETTYVPVSDGAPSDGAGSSSQPHAVGMAGEGTPPATSRDDAAQKGCDQDMKTVALKLGLSEDAEESVVLAEVNKLAERVETAEKALADRDAADRKREFEAKLAEAMAEDVYGRVHVLPGQKDMLVSLAERDHEGALAFLAEAMEAPGFKLGAEGSGSEGDRDEAKRADIELSEKAQARAAKDGVDYGTAMRRVLAEDKQLRDDYRRLMYSQREV